MFWVHVFVGVSELIDGVDMHTSFMGKRASADKRLTVAWNQVGRFVDVA